ncbi:hypothetical protein [uncultured Flavobacterium sp.]|uniref:hypothetical protein n=1 Tax=uncultured Flavobacterium sp. TaxID=165435 RepID=UPI0025EB454A|nr:hypothetical protein [uncultured Flavobacterium sp.]
MTSELTERGVVETSERVSVISKQAGIIKVLNPERNYSRIAINKLFTLKKTEMHAEALKRGQKENIKNAVFTDGYTGRRLLGGISNYEFDHVRSSEYIFKKYKSILTDEQIAQVVNCDENILTTSTKINRAKGKWPLESLLNNTEKKEELGINSILANQALKNADEGIKRKVSELILNK